jgi:hypothetical protein
MIGHTHDGFVLEICLASKVEQYSHVVLVVCSVEASDIDTASAHAVAKILGVKRRSSVVSDEVFLSTYRSDYVSFLYGGDNRVEECQDHKEKRKAGLPWSHVISRYGSKPDARLRSWHTGEPSCKIEQSRTVSEQERVRLRPMYCQT